MQNMKTNMTRNMQNTDAATDRSNTLAYILHMLDIYAEHDKKYAKSEYSI